MALHLMIDYWPPLIPHTEDMAVLGIVFAFLPYWLLAFGLLAGLISRGRRAG